MQSADHPERLRLVFSSQLHHQLQTIARHRELVATDRVGLHGTRTREVNGWEVEKKMVLLKELRPLLEKPTFLYADCGGAIANNSHGASLSFLGIDAYFNKTLPLASGQQSLLDLWEYLLDMCEYVPVRNRCRSLYLHCIACISRRLEFIPGYRIDGEVVSVDDTTQARYYTLLQRCVVLCTQKLTQSRILLEENALFMAHVYSVVTVRFPTLAGTLFNALIECTRVLEASRHPRDTTRLKRSRSEPAAFSRPVHTSHIQKSAREKDVCRSPMSASRNWNALTELERRNSGMVRPDERTKAILQGYSSYKQTRKSKANLRAASVTSDACFKVHLTAVNRRTVEAALCEALEADMKCEEPITQEEVSFIQSLPVIHAFSSGERAVLQRERMDKDLEIGLAAFADRIMQPERDDILAVYFIGAFLSDFSYWCDARDTRSAILWHCIPGYFSVVRTFVAVFKRMCQRRPRMTPTTQATVGNILSIVEGNGADLWQSYWTTREVNFVIDALSEVVKNRHLVDIFVMVVLESTNIFDPASVNYSLSILQRVMEVSAMASSDTNMHNSTRTPRGSLGVEFNDEYFCDAMRKALQSSHVQILLKALTFLYSCLDLLPSRGRRRIISELVIRDNFFRLFLHWNEEIRKIYSYIIAFKVFASNRLDLPCTSDHILLIKSPFFGTWRFSGKLAVVSPPPSSGSFGYWSHLSDIAHSVLKSPSAEAADELRSSATSQGLSNLIAWETIAPTLSLNIETDSDKKPRRVSLFHASLDDDDISVDLLVASKLDASFKMLADQIARKKVVESQYFPVEQEAYAKRAVAQYVNVLWEYYTAASDRPESKPPAPKLEFTITSPFSSD